MQKYYHQDIYLLDDEEIFQTRDTMIEYLRDNWEEYCNPIGDEQKLVTIQDDDGKIILTHSCRHEDGTPETSKARFEYKIVKNTWLISDLEKMTQYV